VVLTCAFETAFSGSSLAAPVTASAKPLEEGQATQNTTTVEGFGAAEAKKKQIERDNRVDASFHIPRANQNAQCFKDASQASDIRLLVQSPHHNWASKDSL